MSRCIWPVLTLTILTLPALADTYYVATDGSAENDGSRDSPWPSVEHALSQVGGGHTIIVKPGIYRGPIQISKAYAGTERSPTIIKSELKWKAMILGAEVHGISNGDACDWVVVDGFEVMGAGYDGIKMNGNHNVVRNCWVHHNASMGIGSHDQVGTVIESNLIEFNGSHIQFHHGVYASGDGLTVRNNVVRHNAGFGLHLYSSIKNSVVANNLVYGQAVKPGIIVACADDGGNNVVVNNTVVSNNVAISVWQPSNELIVNNILVADEAVLSVQGDQSKVRADYNLCLPESRFQGPHGIAADPMFVYPSRGVYWLRPGSPAIGKGAPEYAPESDFWGHPRAQNAPVDLGAFPFVPFLTTDEARADWYYGWPYSRPPHGNRDMPDLWSLPPEAR